MVVCMGWLIRDVALIVGEIGASVGTIDRVVGLELLSGGTENAVGGGAKTGAIVGGV